MHEQVLICAPNSATNCVLQICLQICPICYFSCLAREEMMHQSRSPVAGDGTGRQTDGRTELGWYKYTSLCWGGRQCPSYSFQRRNQPRVFCWVTRLGGQGRQTNAHTKLVLPSRQHGQRDSKIIIIIIEVVYWLCCCCLQGQGIF